MSHTAIQRHCLFLTLTVPSRMHPMRVGPNGRQPNPEYDGSTPKDAQALLALEWARVRARFKRHGVKSWGIRIAEPHFDGTPHWHVVMWGEASGMQLVDVMRLCRGGNVCVMAIAPEGMGTVGKYFAKCDGAEKSRASAWAACWGIRLFGYFGIWPEGGAA